MHQKRHKNVDVEDVRPQKRKRGDVLERSLSRLQLEELEMSGRDDDDGKNDNDGNNDNDIEMEKSGSYEPDKNRIIIYDLDEFNSDEEDADAGGSTEPKYKVPKLVSKTHDLFLNKLSHQQQQGGQLVLYKPLHIPTSQKQQHQQQQQPNTEEAMEL